MNRPWCRIPRAVAPRPLGLLLVLLGLPLAQGCELAEVTTPAGDDLLVVEAVLRAGEPRQTVLLHRTVTDGVVRGERGARVVLREPEGREVVLEELPLSECVSRWTSGGADSLAIEATCYATPVGSLAIRPGARYELRVDTRAGDSVRGQTRVPGRFELRAPRLPTARRTCWLPPATPLEVVWSPSAGAWSYLATIQISGLRAALAGTGIQAPEVLELTGVAISESDTSVVVPGELGVFERFDSNQELLRALQGGFPSGVSVELLLAAADRNFINGVRGGRFNPSGNVRISSVVGDGIGVFGSLVPRRLYVSVSHSANGLPRCIPAPAG